MAVLPISLSQNLPASTNATVHAHKIRTTQHSSLKAHSKFGNDDALRLIESPSEPDLNAYTSLLHSCISRKSLEHGRRLYLKLLIERDRRGHIDLLKNPTLKSKFITLFSVCGRLDEARRVFEDGLEEDESESVWVAMAIAYSRNGCSKEALVLYCEMLRRFVEPGNFAFSIALKASTELFDLWIGRALHAQTVKSNEKPDQVVNNALLRLYAGCGLLDDAVQVFEEMPRRNIVSWNSLLAGFVCQDRVLESLDTFRRMQREERMGFSWVTLTTILPVCVRITALQGGKEIHAEILKSPSRPDVPVLNSLMDMYAKCGAIDYCKRVFDRMQVRDLASWNTLLAGYAVNGRMTEAMEIFNEMMTSGFDPDGITFIALLSGCSHSGLIDDGWKLFDRMEMDFGVSPTLEHYSCLVDLLGRAGRIKKALEVVENMPMKPGGSIWGSLLNSCRLYGNVSLGEAVAKRLFKLEPYNPGNFVMLSNIYAKAGLWERVKLIREMMERRGIKKEAGRSWIQIKNRFHNFVAGGAFEFRNSAEYKRVWNDLMEAMKESGYVPETGVVLHDVDEELKESWVCGHSERLATVFALIHTRDGMPIRITKNLRVCLDCHSWMKIVSRVTGRMIVLRDLNRFHHFRDGKCSCKDFW